MFGGNFANPQQATFNPNPYQNQMNQQAMMQNVQYNRSMEEVLRVLNSMNNLLGNQIPIYTRALTMDVDVTKNQLQQHIKHEKQQVDRLRSLDDGRLEQIRRRCEEARQRNALIMHEVLRIQEDVVQLANSQGRIQRRADCDAELYRRVSETKRILAETDRKLYEIKSIGVEREKQPEDVAEKPLKDLERGVQLLSTETYNKQMELDVLLKYANQ